MNEYLHMHPNFGKHKLIPILLLIPVIAFVLVLTSYQKQVAGIQNVASATSQPVDETQSPKEMIVGEVTIPVEVANTEEKRRQGLSNRPPLDDGRGMLFVFPTEDVQGSFWMKDMYFDIDIIWINDGKVLEIYSYVPAHTPGAPEQLTTYVPESPYDYVLEMNAGSADKYGITVGDLVTLPAL